MPSTVQFYIDFSSPFTYLAVQKAPEIARRYGRAIECVPVDLAALKLLAGNTAPPTRTMPIKLKYMRLEQQRWAKRYQVPIAVPAFYDPSLLNRGTFYASDRGQAEPYVKYAFHRVWGLGGSMVDAALISDVAKFCKWSPDDFEAFIHSKVAADRLSVSTRSANENGVFGVPTLVTDDEMWWGNDRLDFFEEHLRTMANR